MTGTCDRALRELLADTRPATLLCIADHLPEPLAAQCEALGCTVTALPPTGAREQLAGLPRFDLALLWDTHAAVPRREGEQLLGALRDLYAARVAVFMGDDAWSEAQLLALGFSRLTRCIEGERNGTLYGFDIATYKSTPDWLNPRFWANPERWDKAWW